MLNETRFYICHKNRKSMGIVSQIFQRFRGIIYKTKYSTGNEEWIDINVLRNHLSI